MSSIVSLHVLCRPGRIAPHGVEVVDKNDPHKLKSVSWRFSAENNLELPGVPICFHERKAEPSYFGGTITKIEREPIADNDGEIRNIVYFTSDGNGKHLKWPGSKRSQIEFHINRTVPLDDLKVD